MSVDSNPEDRAESFSEPCTVQGDAKLPRNSVDRDALRALAEAHDNAEIFLRIDPATVLSLLDERDRLEAELAETHRRLRAHQSLGLAAIFLADTFTKDEDPDEAIREIRDEWLAEQKAPLVAAIREALYANATGQIGNVRAILSAVLEGEN